MMAKTKKKSGNKARQMVGLSLAVAAMMPLSHMAYAQVSVQCSRGIQWGSFATCGGGQLVVTPQATSGFSSGGCLVVLGTPRRAICKVASLTSTTTGSLKIEVTAKKDSIKNGGITMKVSKFNIDTKSAGPTITYTPAALTAKTFNFGVGARLDANSGLSTGAYSGQITLLVTYTP